MGNTPSPLANCQNPVDETYKPKVLVLGESRVKLDKKTVASLLERHGDELDISIGIMKSDVYKAPEGVSVVSADLRSGATTITRTVEGFDRVFIVSPIDNGTVVSDAIDACKAAGVKFVMLLSVLAAADNKTYFGRQYQPVEKYLKKVGPTFDEGYAVLRVPMYIDDIMSSASSIAEASVFYDARDPTKKFTPVAAVDVAKAAGDILADPRPHNGMTYKLVMPAFSLNDLAGVFSAVLQTSVKAQKIPYKAAAKVFLTKGEVQGVATGMTELFKMIDGDSIVTNEKNTGDLMKITGEKPLTALQWVQAYEHLFQKA